MKPKQLGICMLDPVRQEIVSQAQTVVIKVGTNVLTSEDGRLAPARMQALADQLQRIRATGRKVALVSSGAIGAGVGRLGMGKRPTDLPHLQACAAIGQSFLMRAYQECFDRYGLNAAQILLTASDFDNRARYLNARNTILTLFEWGVLPIINENDTVSVAEIKFGDNDHLAAIVTNLLQAPLLILLTSVDGLFSSDPRADPTAKKVATVEHIDSSVLDLAGSGQTTLGTGGMRSKLRAARIATAAGESVIMADGANPRTLDAIFSSEPVGTLFLPHGISLPAWKRWLGFTARPKGKIAVNDGAKAAVQEQGKSLLPVGVMAIHGIFHKGDVVSLCDAAGVEFARGLTNYSANDAKRVLGLRTENVREILGVVPYEEIVHRDNLVVTG
jgi:glutamate 5-kinase